MSEAIELGMRCNRIRVTCPWIIPVRRLLMWDVCGFRWYNEKEVRLCSHLCCYILCEFFDLAAEVEEESIAFPSAEEHDCGSPDVG